MMKAIDIYL